MSFLIKLQIIPTCIRWIISEGNVIVQVDLIHRGKARKHYQFWVYLLYFIDYVVEIHRIMVFSCRILDFSQHTTSSSRHITSSTDRSQTISIWTSSLRQPASDDGSKQELVVVVVLVLQMWKNKNFGWRFSILWPTSLQNVCKYFLDLKFHICRMQRLEVWNSVKMRLFHYVLTLHWVTLNIIRRVELMF